MIYYYIVTLFVINIFIVRESSNYFNWTGPVKTDVYVCVEKK